MLWLQKSAESGRIGSYGEIAEYYSSSVELGREELLWLQKGVDAGEPTSCMVMGLCYMASILAVDCGKTGHYFSKAIDCATAAPGDMFIVGGFFYYPAERGAKDCPDNADEAERAYRKVLDNLQSTDNDKAEAMLLLGAICFDKKEYAEAGEWFARTGAYDKYVNLTDKEAAAIELRYGQMHEYGLGVTKDTVEAAAWYRRAAGRGNEEANDRLELLTGERMAKPKWSISYEE